MPSLSGLTARVIFFIVGIVVLILAIVFTVHSCDQRRSKAAQTRVERSQAEAASNSAADAIATQERSSAAAAASEDLTRSNERDIRNAPGSGDKVNPAARDAGIAALCKRKSYATDPRCHRP
jgi:Flp pilus assembly protein TadB